MIARPYSGRIKLSERIGSVFSSRENAVSFRAQCFSLRVDERGSQLAPKPVPHISLQRYEVQVLAAARCGPVAECARRR